MRVYDRLTASDLIDLRQYILVKRDFFTDADLLGLASYLYGCISVVVNLAGDEDVENLTDRRAISEIQNIYEKLTGSYDVFEFSVKHLFVLSCLFIVGRNLKGYLYYRNLARESLLDDTDHNSSVDFIMLYLAGMAEEPVKYKESIRSLYGLLDENKKRVIRPQYRAIELLIEDLDKYQKASQVTIKSSVEKEFSSFLRGKKIAIAGPVNSGLSKGEEIDGYDLVIRFNHTSNSVYDSQQFGTKTDISYYTNPAYRELVESTGDDLFGLKYACLQTIYSDALSSYLNGVSVRAQYRRSNSLFFRSHGNAVQRLLLDLLRFEVLEVKLFNMNLWLTPHNPNYLARRASLDAHTFIHHDVVTNFLFLKNLYVNNVIQVDSVLSEILNLGVDDYIVKLGAVYSL